MQIIQRPDVDDLPHTEWECERCHAMNSCIDGDCQFCDGAKVPQFYTVAVYLEDRAYGGHEEGGWWYDTATRIDDPSDFDLHTFTPKIFPDEDAALAFAREINAQLEAGANADRRSDVSSVISEGCFRARVCEGYPDPHFPEIRPHYE
jgi:hypothetical protein